MESLLEKFKEDVFQTMCSITYKGSNNLTLEDIETLKIVVMEFYKDSFRHQKINEILNNS